MPGPDQWALQPRQCVFAWYLILVAAVVASNISPDDESQARVNTDLIISLMFPITASLHVVWLYPSHVHHKSLASGTGIDIQRCQILETIAAPVAVLTAFFISGPSILSLLPDHAVKSSRAIWSTWSCCTACYIYTCFVPFDNSQFDIFERILTLVISGAIMFASRDSRPRWRRLNRPFFTRLLSFIVSLCGFFKVWTPLLALSICKAIRIYFWNAPFPKWLWPRTSSRLTDLDQVVVCLSGVFRLVCNIYLAYLRRGDRRTEDIITLRDMRFRP